MTDTNPDLLAPAIRRAARRFTRALAAEAVLQATVRVEAWMNADGPAPLFALEEALAAAWPPAAGKRPRHEVIWASAGGAGLRLSAYDAAGRVVLRCDYLPGAKRQGVRRA